MNRIIAAKPYAIRFLLTVLVLVLDHIASPLAARIWPEVFSSTTWFGLLWLSVFMIGLGLFINMWSLGRYKGMATASVIPITGLICFAQSKVEGGNLFLLAMILGVYAVPIVAIAWGPPTKMLFKNILQGVENTVRRILDPIEPGVYVKFDDQSEYVRVPIIKTEW